MGSGLLSRVELIKQLPVSLICGAETNYLLNHKHESREMIKWSEPQPGEAHRQQTQHTRSNIFNNLLGCECAFDYLGSAELQLSVKIKGLSGELLIIMSRQLWIKSPECNVGLLFIKNWRVRERWREGVGWWWVGGRWVMQPGEQYYFFFHFSAERPHRCDRCGELDKTSSGLTKQ